MWNVSTIVAFWCVCVWMMRLNAASWAGSRYLWTQWNHFVCVTAGCPGGGGGWTTWNNTKLQKDFEALKLLGG